MKLSALLSQPKLEKGLYHHYKGNAYQVLELACDSETLEWSVVYKALQADKTKPNIWVRPYKMFIEMVEVKGKTIPRFEKATE